MSPPRRSRASRSNRRRARICGSPHQARRGRLRVRQVAGGPQAAGCESVAPSATHSQRPHGRGRRRRRADIDFARPPQAIFTLDRTATSMTLTGTAAGDKRWIEVESTKDAALAAKTKDRAFEIASYRYDAIFRPLDQLLVPKEIKPRQAGASKSDAAPRRQIAPTATRRRDQRHERRFRPAPRGADLRRPVARGAAHASTPARAGSRGARDHRSRAAARGGTPTAAGAVADRRRTTCSTGLRSGQTLGMRAWHLLAVS